MIALLFTIAYGAFATALILSIGMISARSNRRAKELFEREQLRRLAQANKDFLL